MRNHLLFILLLIFSLSCFSQVGIGTVTPSDASMLEISGTSNGGTTYKGLMPPRIPSTAARNLINPQPEDTGLMIYFEESNCFQLWNGLLWENIHCSNSIVFSGIAQNFDGLNSWGYSSDVTFFNNGAGGFYGITTNARVGFTDITTLTNQFLGFYDLNDSDSTPPNGTNGDAIVTFSTIDISSALSGVTLNFDYEFFEFDGGDDVAYSIIIDGLSQPEVILINGVANLSLNGTVSENIPPASTIALQLRFSQNGQTDAGGFDNFTLIPN